ncbi:hypothetical protein N24_1985 [Corynebacterium suranareeae]|uniref:DUF4190 domain-containing protein n=1 Tax=Corynebacterium suranareeae TaxID=2506452 RepID=A0A160PQ91_9CORY|nr:hypothetical protein [Corynebacterium suranareeae]BAU96247.1 hypothetical protein N24_1985 [Corynebacterium suranareeae]
MTTPNYPYGEPNNQGDGANIPFDANQGSPYAAQQPGFQDPYNTGYTGGFENSPLNAPKNTAAAWALGLGIASLVALVAVVSAVIAPVIAIAGIIVSIIALVKAKNINGPNKRKGFAITGLILSILTLLITAAIFIIFVVVLSNSGLQECATLVDPAAQQQCVEDLFN